MTRERNVHEWGPWTPKYNIFGELLGYAERRCTSAPGCGYETWSIPTLHELLVMSRKRRRARD